MRHDARRHAHRLTLGLVVLLLLAVLPAGGAELTVATYVDLTIARLELARATWSAEGRSPAETEEAALFEANGTTRAVYYRFAGENAEAIESFLSEDTAKRDTIEALSQEIRLLTEQSEVQP